MSVADLLVIARIIYEEVASMRRKEGLDGLRCGVSSTGRLETKGRTCGMKKRQKSE